MASASRSAARRIVAFPVVSLRKEPQELRPDINYFPNMAFVSITEAAKLVRRNRSTLYRDIERGRLSKTVTPEGETQIETSELLRTYGRLHANDAEHGDSIDHDKVRIAILEERNRSLERALALEAELRKVKDQVTTELRARLADKDSVIKVLESKVLFLEYDKQVESLKPEPAPDAASAPAPASASVSAPAAAAPVPAAVTPEAAKPSQPHEQSAESVRRSEEHTAPTPTPAPEPEPERAPQAEAPARPDAPSTSEWRGDSAIPLREADTSPENFMQQSARPAQAEATIISSHVMPRKSWWARLLHRR
jgi:hypothetical protein